MNKKSIISDSDDIILKLKVLAKEKENIRKKLEVTTEKLATTAVELKRKDETLEQKVIERTKDIVLAKARDEAILASMGEGLVAVDKEGRILIVNNAFEILVGWKEKEVLGKLLVEVVPREDESHNIVPFKERILTKILSTTTTTTTTTTWYYIRKDKSRFPVSTIITPIVLGGKIVGAVETFRDITKEKEIEETKEKQLRHEIELETKEKDFISIASHQLLTPLTLIKGYTSMLISGKLGKVDDEARKYLEESLQGSERISNLVNHYL